MIILVQSGRFGTSFSPSNISGLVAHWDAQDASSFAFFSGGPASGTISAWLDQTANDNDCVTDGAGNAPERTDRDGLFWVEFDGVDEYFVVPDDASINFGSGDFTIIVVFKTGDANQAGLLLKTAADFDGSYILRVNNGNTNDGQLVFACRDTVAVAESIREDDENFQDDTKRSIMAVRDGNNLRLYSENVETTLSPEDASTLGDLDTALEMNIGSNGQGASHHLDGDIGEILMYDNAISAEDRASLQAYLNTRWSL